ncbi:probable methyltransferase-like protein 24 isoform X1 [Acipenser ruthenus]|uniref:probable methyltransferase-like protein 24 isoform X1 n=1 Tax=Acipenser ruthenus TaxID=7906 RepID=UPI001560BCAD|nr:probable methyltransferase-like protein 24 isoform X1 [Acipenser ruthenus]
MGSGGRLYCAFISACLVVLGMLLMLQVFVGFRAPGPRWVTKDGVTFTIISIDNSRDGGQPGGGARGNQPERSGSPRGLETRGAVFLESEAGVLWDYMPQFYQDENENVTQKQSDRSQIDLQPWAGGQPSFKAEVQRFIEYISTTQVHCARELTAGAPQEEKILAGSWTVCLEGWFLNKEMGPCVAYSFSLDQKDAGFVSRMASLAGCEVHQFDPGARPVLGRDERGVKRHQTWLDWREPKHGSRRNTPKKLGLIMESLGHHKVEFVQADLESAEWKVLENLVLDGTLGRIQQLVVTVHLHWAGFEVGGSEAGVVRFWYSLLKELQGAGYRLLHSATGPGHTILRHRLAGVSSTYTLSWVNTRWNY